MMISNRKRSSTRNPYDDLKYNDLAGADSITLETPRYS